MADESLRPFVTAALFCERVLREQDGVLSLIRIIDQVTCNGPTAEMPPTPLQFNVVLAFKAGFLKGKYMVKFRPEPPSKKEYPALEVPAYFEGDDRGVNLVINFSYIVQEEGVHWFDVMIQDEVLTRIPLRILYQKMAMGAVKE